MRRAIRDPKLRLVLLCAALVIPAAAYATIIGVPNTFTNGTIADANEVNANFSALVTESNAQDARLSVLEAGVASNASSIASNFSSISNNISNINSNTANLATDATLITNNSTNIATNLAAINSHSGSITANVNSIASNTILIGTNAVDVGALQTTFASASLNGSYLTFSGVNVAILDGSGTTDGATNSLGNLVIGYNENGVGATRTGSHNLIVGIDHEYTSHSGMVVGLSNTIIGPGAVVSGGRFNLASGDNAAVSGGNNNDATGDFSSVSGGQSHVATGLGASVSGGQANKATADFSSVSGGEVNWATGWGASVSGGVLNTASGQFASVSGGELNEASGVRSSVSGGTGNTASGYTAVVSGGMDNTASNLNTVIVGGNLISSGGSKAALGLEIFPTSISGGDVVPEAYQLTSPPITCDSSSRGRIFVGRPSVNDQDSICYCGEFSGNHLVYCFNP